MEGNPNIIRCDGLNYEITLFSLTSVFIPRAKEAAAATIKMISVVSRQASQTNVCTSEKKISSHLYMRPNIYPITKK